jgi:hypothetical protein
MQSGVMFVLQFWRVGGRAAAAAEMPALSLDAGTARWTGAFTAWLARLVISLLTVRLTTGVSLIPGVM